jgi:hypothetical protein
VPGERGFSGWCGIFAKDGGLKASYILYFSLSMAFNPPYGKNEKTVLCSEEKIKSTNLLAGIQ